ncbi:MAG: hypothetical protein ACFFER_06605, partial [Candidatus Thorarchaeota archaeon]
MHERIMAHKRVQDSPGLGQHLIHAAIAGILLASLLGAAINIAVPDVVEPDFDVISTPVTGTVGLNVAVSPLSSQTDLILQNDSSFSPESGWRTELSPLGKKLPFFERTPRKSGIQLDISNVAFSSYYDMNLNIRDYEEVMFSFDSEVLHGPVKICFGFSTCLSFDNIRVYSGHSDSHSLATGDSSQLSIELDMADYRNAYPSFWLMQSRLEIEIIPLRGVAPGMASVILENVTVTASASSPLSLLRFDFQNTEGFSIFESGVDCRMMEWPVTNLTAQDDPTRWGFLSPFRSNDTLYVSAGNYSGFAGTYYLDWPIDTYPVSFSVVQNTCSQLNMRFEMIRVNLLITSDIPYLILKLDLRDEQPNLLEVYYRFTFTPPFPHTLYIPKRESTIEIEIDTPSRIESSTLAFAGIKYLTISGPTNIDVSLRMPLFPILGILLSTGELLLAIFGLALFTGAMLNLRKASSKRNWAATIRDPRFWPVLLIGMSAAFPWFVSCFSMNSAGWPYIGDSFILSRRIHTPLALSLNTTDNSLALLGVNHLMIVDITIRILLFWFPLYGAAMHIGWSSKWKLNFYYAAYILLPLCLGVLTLIFT